jgi:hypothetical protein
MKSTPLLHRRPLYIETKIRGDLETLWAYTQEPAIHQQWDLRFSEITYLPKEHPDAPQLFRYSTKVGFGLKVEGTGESVGTKTKDNGESTSVLKFASGSPLSIIRTGSGYWKYIPQPDGIRFFTGYDYETRWGAFGRLFDKIIFRPMMTWATAWSFDALKRWIEEGQRPALSIRLLAVFGLANALIALTWLYHGIVPKLLYMETGELAMVAATGLFAGMEPAVVYAVGVLEVLFGLAFLFFGRYRILHYLNITGLVLLAIGALIARPAIYADPFNPATTSFGVIGLSLVVLAVLPFLPSAARCIFQPPRRHGVDL